MHFKNPRMAVSVAAAMFLFLATSFASPDRSYPFEQQIHWRESAWGSDPSEFLRTNPFFQQSRPATPAVGGVDPTFNPILGGAPAQIASVLVQPDGKFLVGGRFSHLNGVSRSGIVRFNADGTLDDTFNPQGSGANGTVYAIVIQADGKLLIAGNFTTFNDSAAIRVARLNNDGSLDTTFSPAGSSFSGTIQDMVLQPDGKILVCGSFTSYNGTARFRVARLNQDGSLDTSFANPGVSGFVEELVLQPDGKIVIGGSFTSIASTSRRSVGRLNPDGTLAISRSPPTMTETAKPIRPYSAPGAAPGT